MADAPNAPHDMATPVETPQDTAARLPCGEGEKGRGRGRPAVTAERRRTYRLNLPLDDEDLAGVRVRAARGGERTSSYAARVVVQQLLHFVLLPTPAVEVREQLSGVAGALNDAVYRLNVAALERASVEIDEETAHRLVELVKQLRAAFAGAGAGAARP